jgi:hypothetical protein
MDRQPLGRSLDPLSGEDLGGYLLRLASRLHVTPLHLARITGCITPKGPTLRRALLLTAPSREFADAMRLNRQEAKALTLLDWAPRYPPISRSLAGDLPFPDRWLFNQAPRFCPQCLAGDGSAIQDRYGGAWKKEWHLPVTFACVDHQVMLRDGCTQEHQAWHWTHYLIAQPAHATLRPTQCRQPHPDRPTRRGRLNASCGVSLDRLPADGGSLTPDAITTQRQILDHLSADCTYGTAVYYFSGLRVIATFLRAIWPRSRELIDPAARSAVGDDMRTIRSQSSVFTDIRLLDKPSASATITAALLTAAAAVLVDPDRQDFLAHSIRASGLDSAPWISAFTKHIAACAPPLRQVLEPLTYTSWRTGYAKSSHPKRGYRPEHVPAFLEQDWYLQYFARLLQGRCIKIVRRFVAATLIQQSAGGSIGDAARYLGFSPITQYAPSRTLYNWLATIGLNNFNHALSDLAQRLDATTDPVDYNKRRHAVQDWCLTIDQWREIISCLPLNPWNPRQPILDDHKRQEASAVIWAHVTQGEPCFAPRPIEAAQPDHTRNAWRASRPATLFQLTRTDPGPIYAELQRLLLRHAQQLAGQIDQRN